MHRRPGINRSFGMAGLVSGSFDLFMNTPSNLILFMANGDFAGKIVAPRHEYSAEELARAKREPLYPGELLLQTVVLVKKDSPIKSWKDLEKSKVAVKSFKGSDHAGILLAMRSIGANAAKTEFLTMADAQMGSALARGDVDAVVPSDPYATQIIGDGARVIGYPSAYYFEAGVAVAYMSSQDIVSKKPAAMRAFQRAVLEINRLLNKAQNDASYRKTIAKVTGVTEESAAKLRLPTMSEKNVTFAEILMDIGHEVSGSDLKKISERLVKRGVKFTLGHSAQGVGEADVVVASAAIPDENVEWVEAKKRGVARFRRGEVLGHLASQKKLVAVMGSHGKTTTATMLAQIFKEAG